MVISLELYDSERFAFSLSLNSKSSTSKSTQSVGSVIVTDLYADSSEVSFSITLQ
jgi:hypothetical protein